MLISNLKDMRTLGRSTASIIAADATTGTPPRYRSPNQSNRAPSPAARS